MLQVRGGRLASLDFGPRFRRHSGAAAVPRGGKPRGGGGRRGLAAQGIYKYLSVKWSSFRAARATEASTRTNLMFANSACANVYVGESCDSGASPFRTQMRSASTASQGIESSFSCVFCRSSNPGPMPPGRRHCNSATPSFFHKTAQAFPVVRCDTSHRSAVGPYVECCRLQRELRPNFEGAAERAADSPSNRGSVHAG